QALLKDAWPDAPVREGQGPMRRRSQHGLSMEEAFEARREKMAEERRARKGTLYVVATPIGNLEDITFRAVRILKEVKLIAAEDTRQTAKLLNHYQIRTPLTSFFEHNEQLKIEPLLKRLDDGQAIALVSDAGTPGISDPGYSLVKAAIERGANVVAVPGACAAVAALSASGLPTDAWVFVGFLPQKEKKRRELLDSLKLDRRTLIFYEAPGRAYETIQELCDVLGNRDMVMFREMTKAHEEVIRGKFSKVLAEYRGKEIKGEIVLVVAGWQGKVADREGLSILDRLRLYKQESGLPLADVVRLVARETGTPKSEVYRESLKLVGVDPEKIRAAASQARPPRPQEAGRPAAGEPAQAEPAPAEPTPAAPAPEAAREPAPAAAAPEAASEPRAASAPEGADAPPHAGEEEVEANGSNGVGAPVVFADTVAAAEPELVAEPDARHRMSEEAQPDAPDVRGPGAQAEPASGDASTVPGVDIVEGRPGGSPQVPLAPPQE
ncbi:MAG TPA: 16S rRNA (cytidine(1402)-2'-O)-methyltransferase, partial [Thermodesulfobacteriota bacterium]